MSHCKIWLDNYNGQYFPGNTLQGKFVVNLDSEHNLRGIKVRVKASEHVEFRGAPRSSSTTEQNKSENEIYVADNNFLAHEIMLYGAESGSTTLAPGQHMYPFQFTLPMALPSSFSASKGNILYRIEGIVDLPMRTDYHDEFIFNVQSPIDLNRLEQTPDLMGPSSYSDEKTVCCFCCASGPISLDVELSRRACTSRDTVPMSIRISNQSNVNVDSLKVVLKQEILFQAHSPSSCKEEDENTMAVFTDTGVGAHGDRIYEVKLEIPDTYIPNFDQCKFIKAKYYYQVTASLPSYHVNMDITIDKVAIGNIMPGQGVSPPNISTQNSGINQPFGGPYPPVGPPQAYPGNPGPYPGGNDYPNPDMNNPQQMGFVPTGPGGYPQLPVSPSAPYNNPKEQEAMAPPPSYDSLNS